MKKTRGIRANILLGIGIILVSSAFLLEDVLNPNLCDFISGFGLGIEIVAFFKQCKENKNKQ